MTELPGPQYCHINQFYYQQIAQRLLVKLVCVCVCFKLKDRKRSLSGKTTTTRCGIRETATTRNFVLRLFLNNRNELWHVKICHDAEVVSWLLKKWPQRVRKWKLWKLQWRQWGFQTESHLQPLCKEESNQHWAWRRKIWSGTTRSKNGFSLQLKTSSSWYWDKRCGQGAWPWSRTSMS